MAISESPWQAVARELVPTLSRHAQRHDREGTFVTESYDALRRANVVSALVPTALGGGGASLRDVCGVLRELAGGCASTALALSMHQHLVAAAVWNHRHGKPAEKLLRRVAAEQIVLVSTGATDWVHSVGTMTKVDGGYRVDAQKAFASGSPVAALMITSAQYDDPELGPRVLHFALPLSAPGVVPLDDWDTLGMRATGSQTLKLEGVFVPDEAITLSRPRGEWHPVWSVVTTVAPPIYMAPYVGLAADACRLALTQAARKREDPHTTLAVGRMQNALAAAELAWNAMIENAAELDFEPDLARANRTLVYKTLCANAAKEAVAHAITAAGGTAFFRSLPLERHFRDVQAAHFHPLPEDRQLQFSGRLALGCDPITGAPRA